MIAVDYIVKQDPDVTVETKIQREGLCFFDVEKEPFQIYGVFRGFYSIAQAMAPVVEKIAERLTWEIWTRKAWEMASLPQHDRQTVTSASYS